jgi:branched-subunit amino acid aminotransferase/4-amino-4-deoxychorismate lyase
VTRKILIPLDAPALARGVGFFETLLVVRGRPVFLREHFERMERGVRSIDFPGPEEKDFEREVTKAAQAVEHLDEASVRISWLAVNGDIDRRDSWKLFAVSGKVPESTVRRRSRGRVIILGPHLGRTSPELKSVSYIPSVLGLREAHRREADEALFTNEKGRVLEGTTSNVFALTGTTLVTPPVSAGLLPGVMRRWVVENAARVGLEVRERTLTRKDLLAGSFLTGSLTRITRIRFVDGTRCRLPGPALRKLEKLFEREVLGMVTKR